MVYLSKYQQIYVVLFWAQKSFAVILQNFFFELFFPCKVSYLYAMWRQACDKQIFNIKTKENEKHQLPYFISAYGSFDVFVYK